MKKIILILFVLSFLSACNNDDELYFNYKCVILKINSEDGFTNDKFHEPVNCKIWLVRSVVDTILVAELNSCGDCCNSLATERFYNITNKMYYNKKRGDTLFFKYIRKDRFFKLK